ncbi:MAG TPA: TRC40/GET3/ArsA family transport-energizing ATPase [Gemmatimonadaceae bacterium]|nr:TRC40/GET3/ArsA family transport-energizing ATPase [Gemmatimonadaceae bacterium]
MSPARAKSPRRVEELLDAVPPLALIVGKGGVGKTTCALGIAERLAARGDSTLLVSTDPANSLGPVLGVVLEWGVTHEVRAGLHAMQLDPAAARTAFLSRWREVLVTIVDRGTYLDADDIAGLVDAAFPGADEIFGVLVLADLLAAIAEPTIDGQWTRLVVDTAPTGHTLRLLALPETFDALIALLESMQAKHRFMVSALTHRYRQDAADRFLDEMRQTLGSFRRALRDGSRSGAVVVTRAESVVVRETARYLEALQQLGLAVAAVIIEALPESPEGAVVEAVAALRDLVPAGALYAAPRLDPPPAGLTEASASLGKIFEVGKPSGDDGVRRDGKRLRRKRGEAVSLNSGGGPEPRASERENQIAVGDLLRTLTIVGGKGGVGKTTVACALALSAAFDADAESKILLVSTDPAPSIGDALGFHAPRWAHDGPVVLDRLPTLHVWQMDATAAFQGLRERYRDHIDSVFDSLLGQSVDIAHDRTIVRDLLALAPPGIDELYALASLGEALANAAYARIIVDPAPTGHLLRLLQLPSVAIDWSHRLMRLIMKYREITGITEAAADLVAFSRRTRALDALLHDEERAGVLLVSLGEPSVRSETERLGDLLRATGIAIIGEVRNRTMVGDPGEGRSVVIAPQFARPLIGVEAIRQWTSTWTQAQ